MCHAVMRGATLPPIDLVRVADEHHVSDGRHRVSVASASVAFDEVIGMPIEQLVRLDKDFVLELLGIDISASRRRGSPTTPPNAAEAGVDPR